MKQNLEGQLSGIDLDCCRLFIRCKTIANYSPEISLITDIKAGAVCKHTLVKPLHCISFPEKALAEVAFLQQQWKQA